MIPGPYWCRRYGSHLRRLCARPGCGAIAAATLRFLPTQREAWLVELDDTSPRTEGDLCARHAAGLVLPRGWQLHDERIERPENRDDLPPPPKPRRPPRARRPLRAVPEPQPQLDLEDTEEEEAFEVVEVVEIEVEVVEVEISETVEVEPAEDEDDDDDEDEEEEVEPASELLEVPPIADLDDVFDAQTPLLKRAFENVWPLDGEPK
jgi:hypothetical protein